MAQELSELTLREVSLCDRPANSEFGIPRATVALFKRDNSEDFNNNDPVCKAVFGIVDKDGKTYSGVTYPKSDFAYTPDDKPSHWRLRLTKTPGGSPDAGIVGAAVAALGKGFRGKKVQIPQAALAAVKAKVKAAWLKANAGKGSDELPDILKGETQMALTLEMVEKRLNDQDNDLKILKAENDALKAENDAVCKMTKKERKLYATMPAEKRKEFMGGDMDKRKAMLDECAQQKKQKAAEDSLDDATKAEFAKAGPNRRSQILAAAEARILKAKMDAKEDDKDDDDDDDDDGDDENDNMDDDDEGKPKGKSKKKASLSVGKIHKVDAEVAKLQDEVTKANATIQAITKQQRLDRFVKMAETDLPNTSGSPVLKGNTLMQLADGLGGENSEAFKGVFKTMKDADSVIAKSFSEVGKLGAPIEAEAAFMAKAAEISKRDNISQSKAVEKALEENPELYLAYEKGTRRQVAAF